jgi:hypothetical protein
MLRWRREACDYRIGRWSLGFRKSFDQPGSISMNTATRAHRWSLRHMAILPVLSVLACCSGSQTALGEGDLWKVGPQERYTLPSEIAPLVGDGDTVEIAAGLYRGDVAVWRADNLILRSSGGHAVFEAAGRSAQDKAIWVIAGDNVLVDGIEFHNTAVRDRNGAGIRAEGRDLTIKNSVFAGNENGILTVDDTQSTIVITNSSFVGNGGNDGYAHGLYIGRIKRFVFRDNYVYGTRDGHHVKSRAAINEIMYNALIDGRNGSSSYAIDLADAQSGIIMGNVIHQGGNAQNYHMIHMNPIAAQAPLFIVNNTLVNEYGSGRIVNLQGDVATRFVNNAIAGEIELPRNLVEDGGNVRVGFDEFVEPRAYDFALHPLSQAVDAARPGPQHGAAQLVPARQYRHQASSTQRDVYGRLDAGAFEVQSE